MRRQIGGGPARRRAEIAIVFAMVTAGASVTLISPAAARPFAAVESGEQAGQALAAAKDVASARAALLTIFTHGGIGVADGTGAPPSEALVVVPSWELDGLARAHVAGANISLAVNARAFDTMFRWAGASAVSPSTFAGFLADWFQHPVDPRERFVLDAIEALGLRTDPAYDVAKGAPADAPLPLLLLLEEGVAITVPRAGAQGFATGYAGSGVRAPRPTGKSPCEIVDTAVGGYKGLTGLYTALDKWGASYNPQTWAEIEANLESIETEASAATEAAVTDVAVAVAAINGILQFALAQGYLDVAITQDPRPVVKHERGDPANKTTVKAVVTSKSDTPKELADCIKLAGDNAPSVSLPEAGKPVPKAEVTMTTGEHFSEHLTVDYADGNYANAANGGFGNITDATGTVRMPLQTQPQRAPKGQGKDETRQGTIHLEVAIQRLGLSPSQLIAAILDHIVPWSNDFPVTVRQRAIKARTIKGTAKVDAIILGLQVDLDLKACTGFDGYLTGTVGLSGGFQGGFGSAATALTGLPADGSTIPSVAVHVPEQNRNSIDDPGLPAHGVVTPIAGKVGIVFVDDNTAEVTIDGTPLADIATGHIFMFSVTEGADGCPSS